MAPAAVASAAAACFCSSCYKSACKNQNCGKTRYKTRPPTTHLFHLCLLPKSCNLSHIFLCWIVYLWLLSVSHCSGREAQNSWGWGGPVAQTHMWVAELSSVLNPSVGQWNRGCFLVHASGQCRAEHTLGYFWSGSLFFPLSQLCCPCPFSLSLALLNYLEKQCIHTWSCWFYSFLRKLYIWIHISGFFLRWTWIKFSQMNSLKTSTEKLKRSQEEVLQPFVCYPLWKRWLHA